MLDFDSESHKQIKKNKRIKLLEKETDSTSSSKFENKNSSTDCSKFCPSDDNNSANKMMTFIPIQTRPENLIKGDFVVIKFEKKKTVKHYVGKILSKCNYGDYEIFYLRKKSSGTFVFPNVKDKATVHISDIILQLPMPITIKDTNRTATMFTFKVNLSSYNL